MTLQARLLVGSVLLLGACEEKAPDVAFGEPVRVAMTASRDVPAFELAFAVTRDVAVEPLVPGLSGALHKAVRGCPSFVEASAVDEVTQVAFTVEQGTIRGAALAGAHPDRCLAEKLDNQALDGPAPPKLQAIVQIRFPAAEETKAPGAP